MQNRSNNQVAADKIHKYKRSRNKVYLAAFPSSSTPSRTKIESDGDRSTIREVAI